MSERPGEINKELDRKGEKRRRSKIKIQSGMAERIQPEKQKGVQKNVFASNSAVPLWPGTRHKTLAECPYLSAEHDSSLLLSLTLLA